MPREVAAEVKTCRSTPYPLPSGRSGGSGSRGGGGIMRPRRNEMRSSPPLLPPSSQTAHGALAASAADPPVTGERRRRTGFADLPVELLYYIHILSLSPSFPYLTRHLHSVFRHSPKSHRAAYLLGAYDEHLSTTSSSPSSAAVVASSSSLDVVSFVARFPICDIDVLQRVTRVWKEKAASAFVTESATISGGGRRHGERAKGGFFKTVRSLGSDCVGVWVGAEDRREDVGRTDKMGGGDSGGESKGVYVFLLPNGEIRCNELPKRLFRHLGSTALVKPTAAGVSGPSGTSTDFELIRHLLEVHSACPNSHDGFPLAMAVHADHDALTDLLLRHGADPGRKEAMAVMVAIKRADLEMVRKLLERGEEKVVQRNGESSRVPPSTTTTATASPPPHTSLKRRRLSDRLTATAAMLRAAVRADAREIAEYLMTEKAVVPDIKTIKLLDRRGAW